LCSPVLTEKAENPEMRSESWIFKTPDAKKQSCQSQGHLIKAYSVSMDGFLTTVLMTPLAATSDLGGRRYRRFWPGQLSPFISVLSKIYLTSGQCWLSRQG
jgi:hypothetical protein